MESLGLKPNFWKDRRVFLTGHTGFKGAWLSLWLSRLGAKVTGYALAPPTTPSLYEAADAGRGMDSVIADVRDAGLLAQAVDEARPEIIIHMAAQSLVRESYRSPLETYAVNVMGTAHVLEAARKSDTVKAVVVVTSDKCYENREWVWGYRENEAMGGYDPYSSSKGCAELVTSAFRRSFLAEKGVGVASVRAGNVIGGGDWARDRLVPDMMRAFSGGEPVQIRSPLAVRPWQHVLEPLSGYLLLAQNLYENPGRYAEPFNFGPELSASRPVRVLADLATAAWGREAAWKDGSDPKAPHEAGTLALDSSKARAVLGWKPRLGLDEAVGWTVAWYADYYRGQDPRERTLEQIQDYMEHSS